MSELETFREDFLMRPDRAYAYRSTHTIPWSAQADFRIYGDNPWVLHALHPNTHIRDLAKFMMDMDAKYNRRYNPPAWQLWRMPKRPWTIAIEPIERPSGAWRVLGWALALYLAVRR